MQSISLHELLKLQPDERDELAMALWERLSDGGRDAELALTPEEAELDRRWSSIGRTLVQQSTETWCIVKLISFAGAEPDERQS